MVAKDSAKAILDKYYGAGGKLHKKALRKARKDAKMAEATAVKVAESKPKGKSRADLLKEAKAKGILWFNAMSKEELEKALKASKAEAEKISETAKKRWLAKQK